MEKSKISYIVAAVAAVIGIILLAYFLISHPADRNLFVYSAGAMFCVALFGLLIGLKFRMDEKKVEVSTERKRCNP